MKQQYLDVQKEKQKQKRKKLHTSILIDPKVWASTKKQAQIEKMLLSEFLELALKEEIMRSENRMEVMKRRRLRLPATITELKKSKPFPLIRMRSRCNRK